jgi:hypothetical protein
MPDEAKKPGSTGTLLPLGGSRRINFTERAERSRTPEEREAERPTRLPPPPGDLPDCGPVDPRLILNRDEPAD